MTKVVGDISVSLDGFVTGPDPGPEQGMGRGGELLHTWALDGDAIDGCRWDVRDYRPDLGEVRDGAWVVTTTDADFYQTPNETVPNIITTDQPGDNWTVETKFNAAFETSWQQAGLTVYDGPSNYVKFDPVVDGSGDLRFELRSEVDLTHRGQTGRGGTIPRAASRRDRARITLVSGARATSSG